MIGGHRVDIQSQSAVRRKASGIFDDIGPDHLLIHQSKTILARSCEAGRSGLTTSYVKWSHFDDLPMRKISV